MKKISIHFFIIFVFLFHVKKIQSDELALSDSHGPISMMADHMHKENEFMFSYRLGGMNMSKNFNGSKSISTDEIMTSANGVSRNSGTYMNAPIKMSMEKHMFGIMYAPSNNITLMVMTNYQIKEMKQKRMPMSGGALFDTSSEGLGDFNFTSLFKLRDFKKLKIYLAYQLSFPTGSIDERDSSPSSDNTRLGYKMQNGTGTYDNIVIINSLINLNKIKFGSQFSYKKHLGSVNQNQYKYGDYTDLNLWMSYRWFDFLSQSLKINYIKENKMIGSDDEMNARMSPVMDSGNFGLQKLDLGIGFNFVNYSNKFQNHRFAFEILKPIYKNVRGIQMIEDYKLIFGWQYGF